MGTTCRIIWRCKMRRQRHWATVGRLTSHARSKTDEMARSRKSQASGKPGAAVNQNFPNAPEGRPSPLDFRCPLVILRAAGIRHHPRILMESPEAL
eukprot:586352-Alexandrium_andersonii.AAC.1